jgi:hypothetical protein
MYIFVALVERRSRSLLRFPEAILGGYALRRRNRYRNDVL